MTSNYERIKQMSVEEMAKFLDFSIKENIPKDAIPVSSGFWYDLGDGDCSKFVELIEDEDTKKKCYEAIRILTMLENNVEDIVEWM